MPFKGILHTGKSCNLIFSSAASMPGVLAFAVLWVPLPGVAVPHAFVASIAPGEKLKHTVIVPAAQMLVVDIDLPADGVSTVDITVEEDVAGVAQGAEGSDTEWTFLVVP